MDMKRKKKIVMFLPNLNKGGAEKFRYLYSINYLISFSKNI